MQGRAERGGTDPRRVGTAARRAGQVARLALGVAIGVVVGLVVGTAIVVSHAQEATPQAVVDTAQEAGVDPVDLEGAVNTTGLEPREYLDEPATLVELPNLADAFGPAMKAGAAAPRTAWSGGFSVRY